MPRIHARHDSQLRATVISAEPLGRKSGGGKSTPVRAGSGLSWFGKRLAVVQDDTRALALVDPATLKITTVPFTPGKPGHAPDSKRRKLDLEACVRIFIDGQEALLVFASGSRRRRRTLAVASHPTRPLVKLHAADSLYESLAATKSFSGGALNIEGAVCLGRHVRLINRGNRSPASVNATGDLSLKALLAYLASDGCGQPPVLRNVVRYELGELGGLPLGFTDIASGVHGKLHFTAAAENTGDAGRDGAVAGSVLGVFGRAGARWVELRNRDGSLFRGKVEGLCVARRGYRRLWLITDPDDPAEAAHLCAVKLSGRW